MEELRVDKIHLQNSNDPEILRKHIDTLNLLLQSKAEELEKKDESLKKIVSANQAIENEFKDFVSKIQRERSQQSQILAAIQQQKGDAEAKLDIFQQADHELRNEVDQYKKELSEIKSHKDVTKERYQSLMEKYQRILFMLYQEHNKNLENQMFQEQANNLRDLITQLNSQMRDRIQKEQQSTERSKVLESKMNMYVNAVGSKQQEIDQLKQQISKQNIQLASAQSRQRARDEDVAQLQAKLDERGKLVSQIQQALNDSYKKNEELKAELNAEIEDLRKKLQEKEQQLITVPQRTPTVPRIPDIDDIPPNSLVHIAEVPASYQERQQKIEQKTQEEEEKQKEIEKQLAKVKTMTIEDVVAQAMNLAEEDSVSFLSDAAAETEAKSGLESSQHIQLYNKQGQQHLETLENVVRKNEMSALVVQKFLEENSIANVDQLESKNTDELLKQIQLMEQLIKFKDLQVETLKTSLKQKEHELEEWIYKAHYLQNKIGNLEYLQQENSAVKQQLDLLTMIKKEKQRQDAILDKNQTIIDKQQK